MATIAQISDIHIGGDYGRFNTHANFEKVLNNIRLMKNDIDEIIITGDLADDNYQENYSWIRQKLHELGIRYSILGGNHDDTDILKQVFGDTYREDRLLGGWFLLLNTSKGYITEEQLSLIDSNMVIFTHFPLIPINHNFMNNRHSLILKSTNDKLANVDTILRRLESRGLQNVTIFCGHYHFDNVKQLNRGEIRQFVCPSTQAQLNSVSTELKISCYNPAYRLIFLEGDYDLETEVVYLQ